MMRIIFSFLVCLLMFVSQQSFACKAQLQPVSQEEEAPKEYSDAEIRQFKDIEPEEIEDKEEYCKTCLSLKEQLKQVEEKGEEIDPLHMWTYIKCKRFCELGDEAKSCGEDDNTDPKEKWDKLKKEKEELLSDPDKLKEHCQACKLSCEPDEEKDRADPLRKWKCIQCKRECGEVLESEENKNDENQPE